MTSVTYLLLSHGNLRSPVPFSCDSSISDSLNSASSPWPPKEFCKLEILRLGSPDQTVMHNKVSKYREKTYEKRKMKELVPEFLANLPSVNIYQVGNRFKTGKPIPVVSQIMKRVWDMSSAGFLRNDFFIKNVSIWKEQVEPQKSEGKGKAGLMPRNHLLVEKCKTWSLVAKSFSLQLLTNGKSLKSQKL